MREPSAIVYVWPIDLIIQARELGLLAEVEASDPAAAWFVGTDEQLAGPVYANQAGLRASGLDPSQR